MKHFGYINIYEDPEGLAVTTGVYEDEQSARQCAGSFGYITTIRIEWDSV